LELNIFAFAVVAVLLAGLGVPLLLRKVPPNPWYGVRLPCTFADRRVWYAVNARAGRDFLAIGAAVLALDLGLPAAGFTATTHAATCAMMLVAGTLASSIAAWRQGNDLLRRLREREGGGLPPG
jgi:uncharacterized membrane protein